MNELPYFIYKTQNQVIVFYPANPEALFTGIFNRCSDMINFCIYLLLKICRENPEYFEQGDGVCCRLPSNVRIRSEKVSKIQLLTYFV